ncbi:MAG TPA: signal recognition particle subunit SRP19/SEC65 family protein [Methanocorpusculum sp.]|nr:signal recognition particle subunit SRP19/SEC65 family protein [Methanocorpusculum sp.]
MAVRFLYPCYFNASLTRKEGRRVSKELAWDNPNLSQLARLAKSLDINVIEEDQSARCPKQWYAAAGRLRVEYDGSKETLMRTIAEKMQ